MNAAAASSSAIVADANEHSSDRRGPGETAGPSACRPISMVTAYEPSSARPTVIARDPNICRPSGGARHVGALGDPGHSNWPPRWRGRAASMSETSMARYMEIPPTLASGSFRPDGRAPEMSSSNSKVAVDLSTPAPSKQLTAIRRPRRHEVGRLRVSRLVSAGGRSNVPDET
jgi:hypothetical protein